MSWSPIFGALVGALTMSALVLVVAEVTPLWWVLQGSLIIILIIAGLIDGRLHYRKMKALRDRINSYIRGES